MLPPEIPLFPLPNVVLFPNVFLPLHIFEPRYRAMVSDALKSERIIGMVLLQPGWDADYLGRPRIYQIGCAGLMTHVDPLEGGRYNIILRGLEKFRILGEVEPADQPYRRARIEGIEETTSDATRTLLRQGRSRLEELLSTEIPGLGSKAISDEDLVNALAQYLDLEPVEKQALLERDGLPARCHSLIDLLEMKVFSARHPVSASHAH
jgi:Lon protease-like protein